jgi:NAD+ synthase (glutamine-hydrolysing)
MLTYPVPKSRSFFLPGAAPERTPRQRYCEDLLDALAMGIGDYFEKTRAFSCLGIALSGGRDSLLTLLIAHRYAHRAGVPVETFYMPSRFSSEGTRAAAELIASELGVKFSVVSIDDAFERELDATRTMLGPDHTVTPITMQNVQARLRAQRMWNWANSSGGLFLQTGNMSEKAVGYTTIGGDLMGALAVISNLPKTVVMYLLDYLFELHGYQGIAAVTARPAGPELMHDQVGEAELMPFPILDACFHLFAGEKLAPGDVVLAVGAMFPEVPSPTARAARASLRAAVHHQYLQVGAVTHFIARRQPGPRPRARAAASGGHRDGVVAHDRCRTRRELHRRRLRSPLPPLSSAVCFGPRLLRARRLGGDAAGQQRAQRWL